MTKVNILELMHKAIERAKVNDEYNQTHPQPLLLHPLDYERGVREGWIKPYMKPTMNGYD